MTEPTRIGSTLTAELRAHLQSIGDGKVRPTGPNGRMRYCTRCERLAAEFERVDPRWTPPLAHSWVSMGYRYWSDLCEACLAFEKRRRETMRQETHNETGGPKPALGMRSWKPGSGAEKERAR